MPKFIATKGDEFVVDKLDRSYGGKEAEALKVDGDGNATVTGTLTVTGTATVAGKTPMTGSLITKVVTGADASSAAQAVTATGLKVGDVVYAVVNITDLTDASASFESTITVADQIQQSATNLSTKKIMVQVNRK